MKVLCLVDGKVVPPDRWIWNYLPESAQSDTVDFLNVSAKDLFLKWGKLLTYYPSYVWLGIKAAWAITRNKYDVILAWEAKNGFALAVICTLLRLKRPKLVILCYNHRSFLVRMPWLTKLILKSTDIITTVTKWEEEYYRKILPIAPEKIQFCALGWYDVNPGETNSEEPVEDFIFSSGRSYRDYVTLASALEGIQTRAIINARKFNIEGVSFPDNVVINDLLPVKDFWKLLRQAKFIVIPLIQTPHAAGDTVIIQAMSAGKAVIATQSPTTMTYVQEGITGLLVPPGDPIALKKAMLYLLEHPDIAREMGCAARKKFEDEYTFYAFSERIYKTAQEVVQQ
jgi:glycosyltransferase involved in cell wall biosynthesis